MPFDPNIPQAGTEIDAVQMRAQLQALFDDIQTRITDPQLIAAIIGALQQTSANSNAVGQMSLSVDPMYNQAQIQQIADKVDELIAVLRRL